MANRFACRSNIPPLTVEVVMAHFVLLNDPDSHEQRLIRLEHLSAVVVNKADQTVTITLLGGQDMKLTSEESKQLLHNLKAHMHSSGTP
jgi:hypothetical protein